MDNSRAARFCFLVHSRSIEDFRQRFPFARPLPDAVLEFIANRLPPVKVATITGLRGTNGNPVTGEVIGIPMTARYMLNHREKASRRVQAAARYCSKHLGATHIGLGALTSPVTSGGEQVSRQELGACITNGNALTAAVAVQDILHLLQRHYNGDFASATIAVIGGTGSVGQGVVCELADLALRELIVIGRKPESLAALAERVRASQTPITTTNSIKAVSRADLIVVATSAHEAVVQSDDLKQGAVVYDLTQPSNLPKSLRDLRPDLRIYQGGLMALPDGVRYDFDLGIPRDCVFACLAETALLAIDGYNANFCIGKTTTEQMRSIGQLAERYGFRSALADRIESFAVYPG